MPVKIGQKRSATTNKLEKSGDKKAKKAKLETPNATTKVEQTRIKRLYVPSNALKKTVATPGTHPVIYWMSRDQRMHDNWAMLYAQEQAIKTGQPLCVLFVLMSDFPNAAYRHYNFMLRGLEEVQVQLVQRDIPFLLTQSSPTESKLPTANRIAQQVADVSKQLNASLVVTDFSPLRLGRDMKQALSSELESVLPACSLTMVDAHNVVPVWVASNKIEYAARTIRPKITQKLSLYLTDFPPVQTHPHPLTVPKVLQPLTQVDWTAIDANLVCDRTVKAVTGFQPGESYGIETLRQFLDHKLKHYSKKSNDPNENVSSDLSPYLHFGQISAQRCAWETQQHGAPGENTKSFLEQIIVRRELTDNYCYYNTDGYDKVEGLYPQFNQDSWAQKSVLLHSTDPREYIYTRKQFENGKTHDDLWNAAQKQMKVTGKMHSFLRMYWCKKILEWTSSPQEAMDVAIYLNDRWSLDGRDPNGYVGIAWSIGGVHDNGWKERPVFGKIRFMNYAGCKRKFKVANFVNAMKRLKY